MVVENNSRMIQEILGRAETGAMVGVDRPESGKLLVSNMEEFLEMEEKLNNDEDFYRSMVIKAIIN